MQFASFSFPALLLLAICPMAQQEVAPHVRGHVTDSTTHNAVSGVAVSSVEANHDAITDVNGFFALELRDGTKPGDDIRIHLEKEGYRADDLAVAASEKVTHPIEIFRIARARVPATAPIPSIVAKGNGDVTVSGNSVSDSAGGIDAEAGKKLRVTDNNLQNIGRQSSPAATTPPATKTQEQLQQANSANVISADPAQAVEEVNRMRNALADVIGKKETVTFLLSWPDDDSTYLAFVSSLLSSACRTTPRQCWFMQKSSGRNLDRAIVPESGRRGITIRGPDADALAVALGGWLTTYSGSSLPSQLNGYKEPSTKELIWVEIGPGSPWKTPTSPPVAPSVSQNNSGGINVQQATAGRNSPIINSPVTIGNVPKHVAQEDIEKLVEYLSKAKSHAAGIALRISADQYSRTSPFVDDFFNLFKNAQWPMKDAGVDEVVAFSPPTTKKFQGAVVAIKGEPVKYDGEQIVITEPDPLFYIGEVLKALKVPFTLKRDQSYEQGIISIQFEGGFPD